MADLGTSSNVMAVRDARRSTRIPESVRLSVSGQSKVGNPFSEMTLTLAVNCHGCIYPSRNEHLPGSWVTLEFPNHSLDAKAHPVRALVRFVRPPRSPKDHYQVGVELESPANVWRIQSAPEDWTRFPVLVNGSSANGNATMFPAGTRVLDASVVAPGIDVTTRTSTAQPDSGRLDPAAPMPDQVLRALEKHLQQAAEKAVSAAVSSHLNLTVNQAITAIDKFSQASVRQIEEHCAAYQKKLITSAQDELLRRLQTDLLTAQERLQKQLQLGLADVQETSQNFTKATTSEAHLLMAESVDFLKETSRTVQDQFSRQVHDTADRAAAELSAETVRFSDRQLAHLTKQAQSAIGEGSKLIEKRAAEARTQLDAAAGTMLNEFRQRANVEIDEAAGDVREKFVSSLTTAANQIRADWDSRQRAWESELVRSSDEQGEQFRQKLETIVRASMITAISSISENSKALLNSLSNKEEERSGTLTHKPASA